MSALRRPAVAIVRIDAVWRNYDVEDVTWNTRVRVVETSVATTWNVEVLVRIDDALAQLRTDHLQEVLVLRRGTYDLLAPRAPRAKQCEHIHLKKLVSAIFRYYCRKQYRIRADQWSLT